MSMLEKAAGAAAAFAKIKCQSCKHVLNGDDLLKAAGQIELGFIVCPKCAEVINANVGPFFNSRLISKKHIHSVPRFKLYNSGGMIQLEVPWASRTTWYFLLFGIIWCSMLMFTHMYAPSKGLAVDIFSISMMITPLVIPIIYLRNQTFIVVTKSELRMFPGPIPIGRRKTIASVSIAGLSIFQQIDHNDNLIHKEYVNVDLKDGTSFRLCATTSLNESLFVERTIEDFLGIEDDPSKDVVGA
jgi:hypothetical protein